MVADSLSGISSGNLDGLSAPLEASDVASVALSAAFFAPLSFDFDGVLLLDLLDLSDVTLDGFSVATCDFSVAFETLAVLRSLVALLGVSFSLDVVDDLL